MNKSLASKSSLLSQSVVWFVEVHGSLDIEEIEVKIEITFSVVMGRRWNRVASGCLLAIQPNHFIWKKKKTTETIFPPVPSWSAREEGLQGCEASLFWSLLAHLPWNSYKHRHVPFASLEGKEMGCRCSNHTEFLDEPPKGLKTGVPTAWMGLEKANVSEHRCTPLKRSAPPFVPARRRAGSRGVIFSSSERKCSETHHIWTSI